MSEKFKEVIYNSDLYDPEMIKAFGEEGPHWLQSSWRQRELSLRHDKVCILLCNNEMLQIQLHRHEEEELPDFELPIRFEDDPESDEEDPPPNQELELMQIDEDDEQEDTTGNEVENSQALTATITSGIYRFELLEGKTTAAVILNKFCRENQIPYPNSMWDILDHQEKKIIEVKVTTNFGSAENEFHSKSIGIEAWTALCWVDAHTGYIRWLNHPGGVTGDEKVTTFIVNRRAICHQLEVLETQEEEGVPIDTIFCNQRFNHDVGTWLNHILDHITDDTPDNYDHPVSDQIKTIKISELLNKLERPKNRPDCPPIVWRGKTLPPHLCVQTDTPFETDMDMCEIFLQKLFNAEPVRNAALSGINLFEFLSELKQSWTENENLGKNFKLVSKSEYSNTRDRFKTMKEILGIGKKFRKYHPYALNAKQPEYPIPKKRCYHYWYENVIHDLSAVNPRGLQCTALMLDNLFQPEYPIDGLTKEVQNKIIEIVSRSRCGQFMNEIINFYSRLGGAYSSPTTHQNRHSNVVIFPLYSVSQELEYNEDNQASITNKTRHITGICLRGPHHAKSPTDKINLVIIQELDTSIPYVKAIMDLNKEKWQPLSVSDKSTFYISQNAINKPDPSYCTFIIGSIFLCSNLVGEICLPRLQAAGTPLTRQVILDFITNNERWLIARVVEAVLMATQGDSTIGARTKN